MPSAISMLFAAHRDRDALRIDAAMRHLESLNWRERMAPRITEAEAANVLREDGWLGFEEVQR